MTKEIKCTAPSHIVLTLFDDRSIVCPVNYCIFEKSAHKGSYVYFFDKEISVKETIDEIIAMMNAPYNAKKAAYEHFLSQPAM